MPPDNATGNHLFSLSINHLFSSQPTSHEVLEKSGSNMSKSFHDAWHMMLVHHLITNMNMQFNVTAVFR